MISRKPHQVLLIQALGGKCKRCGSVKNLEINHIIPLSEGGLDEIDNIEILCRSCHDKNHSEKEKRKLFETFLILENNKQFRFKVKRIQKDKPICPKCGLKTWQPTAIVLTNKYDIQYYYAQYEHKDERKKKGVRKCNVKITKEEYEIIKGKKK